MEQREGGISWKSKSSPEESDPGKDGVIILKLSRYCVTRIYDWCIGIMVVP